MYDYEEKEEIFIDKFRKRQKLYAKEEKYDIHDIVSNPNQPAIQQPQPAPPQPPSTTKKKITRRSRRQYRNKLRRRVKKDKEDGQDSTTNIQATHCRWQHRCYTWKLYSPVLIFL